MQRSTRHDRQVVEPAWKDRRLDVIAALDRLATITLANANDGPDLSSAVHWLVDDTFWDQHSPAEEIGLLVRDQAEADAVTTVLDPLLSVLDELGPIRADKEFLQHPLWPEVARSAADARDRLTRQG